MTDSTTTTTASTRKVDWDAGPVSGCPRDGVHRITDYAAARAFLRSPDTLQAGFGAEEMAKVPARMRRPILYQDGPEHREQRRLVARFFTARKVAADYREVMERFADEKIAELTARGEADLDQLGFTLSVEVVSMVLGLTDSKPGMPHRLEKFFVNPPDRSWSIAALRAKLRLNAALLSFYVKDVRPAVKARRKNPADDVISHLIAQGCTNGEILTECVTFAPAGMITTREFISVAAWHLLSDRELLEAYRAGDEPARLGLLQELLRLDPVLDVVRRRTTADIEVPDSSGAGTTIPAGCLVEVSVAKANADMCAVGPRPLEARLDRDLAGGVKEHGLSFGDGAHRCPGAHIALQETDILLCKLFALEGLRMVRTPSVTFLEAFSTYEVRGLRVAVA